MASYNLNEILKKRAQSAANLTAEKKEMDLGDAARVKVLSPMRQVFKRFVRNRLAMFGVIVLVIMFLFCFLGPYVYPHGQKEVFEKYDTRNIDYAYASVRTDYNGYVYDESVEAASRITRMMNSYIKELEESGLSQITEFDDENNMYFIDKMGDKIYSLSKSTTTMVATAGSAETYIGLLDGKAMPATIAYEVDAPGDDFAAFAKQNIKGKEGEFVYNDETYKFVAGSNKSYEIYYVSGEGIKYYGDNLGADFEAVVNANLGGDNLFEINGVTYKMKPVGEAANEIYLVDDPATAVIYSTFYFDTIEIGTKISDEFRAEALNAAYTTGAFTVDGADYTIAVEDGALLIRDAQGDAIAELNDFVVKLSDGSDTMELSLKHALRDAALTLSGTQKITVEHRLPEQDENGKYVYNENNELQYVDSELYVSRKDTGGYEVRAAQIIKVMDIFASPSSEHILGTDGDAFDVFARIMYGGRISLMVGFIVVILEIILGVIMGGLAGYFGGWVDNLIMRLVDIFYCLPTMPIMIIIGTMMDAARMGTYMRLMVMMAALGVMGWAGIARIVRGQILSLREQEFMTATEATGLRVSRRIFRHLVPNVMPQLIVIATMGLGGIILTESTLSFLGLGVKHPLATWGTMINSVSTMDQLENYYYIWIPVGLLICMTVIAFNFVGDGLRDAFDPKAKR